MFSPRSFLCSLCLCGSIRDGDSHRRDSPQRRGVHREDRLKSSRSWATCSTPHSPVHRMLLLGIEKPFSACSVPLWFNPGR